jgi:hypothetical protein
MVNITSQNGDVGYNVTEVVLDTPNDLEILKTKQWNLAPGSSAFIISTSEVYMLNGSREWVKI